MAFDSHATIGVYYGRLAYPLADPTTPFYMVFPTGIYTGAQCFVLSSFAKDYSGNVNRLFTSIIPRVALLGASEFTVKKPNDSTDEYYWFKGKVSSDGAKIEVSMFNPGDTLCTKIQVDKANESNP